MIEQVKALLEGARVSQVKVDKDDNFIYSLEILTADGDIVIIYGDDLSMNVVYNRAGDHRRSK